MTDAPLRVDGVLRIPLRRFEDDRGWFCELRRDSALPRPTVQTNLLLLARRRDPGAPLPRTRPGRPLRVPPGHGAGRRPRPGDGRDVHRGHRRREPRRDLRARPPRPRLRGAHRSSVLLPRDRGVRPRRPGRARNLGTIPGSHACGAPRRRSSPSATPHPDHGRRRPARPRARARVRRRRRSGPRGERWDVRFDRRRCRGLRARCCTRPRGRTSTAPRTIRRAPRRRTSAARPTQPPSAPARRVLERLRVRRDEGRPYLESDAPRRSRRTGAPSCTARRRRASVPGSSAPAGSSARPGTTSCGRCSASGRARRGRRRRRPARLPDLRRSPRRGDARAGGRRRSLRDLAPRRRRRLHLGRLRRGDLREAGLACRVRRISSAEFGAKAPRPAPRSSAARRGLPSSALADGPRLPGRLASLITPLRLAPRNGKTTAWAATSSS